MKKDGGIAGTLLPTLTKYTQAQLYRIKEANNARQAAQPLKLIERVSINSQSISGLDLLFAVECSLQICSCFLVHICSQLHRQWTDQLLCWMGRWRSSNKNHKWWQWIVVQRMQQLCYPIAWKKNFPTMIFKVWSMNMDAPSISASHQRTPQWLNWSAILFLS